MNSSTFSQAQNAYENKDFAKALDLYNSCANDQNFPLLVGEFGLVYHQIGNCLVKLSNYSDAINAYASATTDTNYNSLGTVYYNLGMAYVYMNDFGNAIANFQTALNDPNYTTKYKAFSAMGNALMKNGKPAEAGAAFRKSALDPNNPDPTRALLNLGVCFMALGRPEDAVTVYESAFQFNTSSDIKNRLNSNLGQAYVASGQMQQAVRVFENALKDKTYVLSDSASVDYQRAIAAVSKGADLVDMDHIGAQAAIKSGMEVNSQSEQTNQSQENVHTAFDTSDSDNTNKNINNNQSNGNFNNFTSSAACSNQVAENNREFINNAPNFGVDNAVNSNGNVAYQPDSADYDNLNTNHDSFASNKEDNNNINNFNYTKNDNNLNASKTQEISNLGNTVNSEENTLNEQNNSQDEFEMWSKSAQEAAYNPQKRKSPAKIALVVILSIVGVVLVAAVILYVLGFGIPSQENITYSLFSNPIEAKDSVFASNVSDYKKDCYTSMVSQTSNANINAVNKDLTESCVYVSANTATGGLINYKIKMSRDVLSWKIQNVDLAYSSQTD